MSIEGLGRPSLHQFIAAAAPHDAVTSQAIALQDELRDRGIASAVVAEHVHPAMADRVHRLDRYRVPRGPALLRYSIWSKAAQAALDHHTRLGVVYHNITPAELVGPANRAVAAQCTRARRELPRIVRRSHMMVADSTFNAMELEAEGAEDVQVIPLLLDLPRQELPRPVSSMNVLFVGRIAPNKRIEDLIDTAIMMGRHIRGDVHFRIIGSPAAFPGYQEALLKRVRRYGVEATVSFLGELDDAGRDREFADAGAYLSMSEHEGFCVPILEAMAHGVPVVARDAGAVRETAGGGALLVPSRDPLVAAAVVARALTDEGVRSGLAQSARRRLAQLDRSVVADQITAAVEELIT